MFYGLHGNGHVSRNHNIVFAKWANFQNKLRYYRTVSRVSTMTKPHELHLKPLTVEISYGKKRRGINTA